MKRQTKQREIVVSIFEKAGRPLSPQEVFEGARSQIPSISLATIYRALRSLHEEGAIVPVALPGESDRYETRRCAETHHHHFHCELCGRVFDVPGCGLRPAQHLPSGFSVKRHEIVLYGSCNDCDAAAM